MSQPFRLDGRVALVTGGASGIGEAICRLFTASGAHVLIVDRDGDRAEALQRELSGSRAVVADITAEQNVLKMFADLDKLDILVNNAGVGYVGGVEDTDVEHFRGLFDVNVLGMFLVTRSALPL